MRASITLHILCFLFASMLFQLFIIIRESNAQISMPAESLLVRLEQIAASDSATPIIHNNLGFAYFNLGRINDAIDQYLKAIKMNPSYAGAFNNLGYAYSRLNQMDKAIESFQEAIRLDPLYADAYNNIGLIFMSQSKIKEAMLQFRQAIIAKPEYHFAYGNLGFAYFRIGMLDSAIAVTKRAVEIQPAFSEGYNVLGMAYFQEKKSEEAINEYKRALKVNPENTHARFNLAIAYDAVNKYDEAEKELENLLMQESSNILFAYQLALHYFNTMKLEKAEKLGRQIVNADSMFVEGFLLMGRIEKAYSRTQDARQYFLRAAALNPKLGDPWYNLGILDLDANLLVDAEKELQKARVLAPEKQDVQFALGLIYLRFNEPEKAIEAFENELKLTADFPQAKNGLEDARAMKQKFDDEVIKGSLRARIILVKTKKEADGILKQLKAGEEFTHLAFHNSILPSAENGGDVGFMNSNDIHPEIAGVLHKLKKGEISSAIKTEAGYQIILRLN